MAGYNVWPSDLPQRLRRQGFSYQPGPSVLRSEVDVGPAKMRRRYTATVDRISGTLALTASQRLSLEVFYRDTLSDGSLAFGWYDSYHGRDADMRIVEPPQYTLDGAVWIVALSLEVLP